MTADSVFRHVNRSPLSLTISRHLRAAIVSGELAVGTELPTEKVLAERFGVSRPTIREALRILQAQGLLTGGDTVSTARPRVSVDQTSAIVSEALVAAIKLGQVPLDDLVELRHVLEVAAVAQPVADQGLIAQAREALAVMQEPDVGVSEFHEADVRFHIALAGAGGNAAFSMVMTVLREAIAGYLLASLESLPEPGPVLGQLADEHAHILDAIERGRPELAAELMRYHIVDYYNREPHHDG